MTLLFTTTIFIIGKSGIFEVYLDNKRYYCKCVQWSSVYAWDKTKPAFYLDEVKKTPFASEKELIAEQIKEKIKEWNEMQ